MRRAASHALALFALAVMACSLGRGNGLSVRRGDFEAHLLLTGELEAVRSDDISVPKLPQWQTSIRWMERDGAQVKKGQRILELDNLTFVGDLEDNRLAAVKAADELARQVSDNAVQLEEKSLAVEQAKNVVEKARIDAAIPPELLARRDYAERQLALEKASADYEKASNDLEAYKKSADADLAVKGIAFAKAQREVKTAEDSIGSTLIRAPRNGVIEVAEHPWEGRKFQVGDAVFVGLKIMSIPDLSAMRVVADLSDVDEGKVRVGMTATCRLDAFPDLSFAGHVLEVSPIAREVRKSPQRRAFRARVSLDRSLPDIMRSGLSVKVQIQTVKLAAVLLAPRGALRLDSDPPRARLRNGREVNVRLGPCSEQECVVEEGLKEGQRLSAVEAPE